MKSRIKIGNRIVGHYLDPYVVAEIGVNHEGSMNLAKRLIEEAADGGANAAKFQTYKAEKIASRYSPAYWDTNKEQTSSQYELFKKYDVFGIEEYQELAAYCRKKQIDFISTPFDLDAVDQLDPLVAVFKIAGADITNVPLLRRVASKAKPIILSTGASTLAEIQTSIELVRLAGAKELCLLHCILNYPTLENHAQLRMISVLERVFPDCLIGYSDHVAPDETLMSLEMALLMGACVIEKHFTHDKTLPGNDHYHAMDKDDLKRFIGRLEKYRLLFGESDTKVLEWESDARKYARRSVIAAKDIQEGDVITEENITAKRPGTGISPTFWDDLLGMKAAVDIPEDTIMQWQMLKC